MHAGVQCSFFSFFFTIQKLIDEHKVVLDAVLCDGGEVRLQYTDHLVQELKDQSGVDVLSGGGHNPDIVTSCVEVACPGYVSDGGSHRVTCMDHIHTKRINTRAPVGRCDNCVSVCVCWGEGKIDHLTLLLPF